jgi:hypothetical protein
LSLTVRDAVEQLNGLQALDMERQKADTKIAKQQSGQPFETVEGEEGASIADKPHLTGDPEWDAVELAETHPTKELVISG